MSAQTAALRPACWSTRIETAASRPVGVRSAISSGDSPRDVCSSTIGATEDVTGEASRA